MTLNLHDFEGDWQIERRIVDHLTGRTGRLQGRAQFIPDAEGLTYEEAGQLEFPGQPPFSATQRYLWRQQGGAIDILFADSRAFHSFDPAHATPDASHDCPPDWYEVSYSFVDWPTWSAQWSVRGPRKNYISTTRYTRLCDSEQL